MDNVLQRLAGCLLCTCFLFLTSLRLMGALQQAGYQNKGFLAWFGRKDNLQKARLALWAAMAFASCAIFGVCFSFLGETAALMLQSVPFVLFCILYLVAEKKYALKVPLKRTGRIVRLSALYVLFLLCFAYIFVAILNFIRVAVNLPAYTLFAYTPFALFIYLTPYILCLANACESVFENARNKKFVKRAGQVLDESKIIKVGIVGSYAKTSVKNILSTILRERYLVVATPLSYNTPMGIALTVESEEFSSAQVFIAEMGARKQGDIAELCQLVQPDYAIFTGVCAQHIASFGSEENVLKEKSNILTCGAKTVVCDRELQQRIDGLALENVSARKVVDFAQAVKEYRMQDGKSSFTLVLGGKELHVMTALLGLHNAENIALAATLAYQMGFSVEEIASGIAKILPVEHRLQLLKSERGVYILDDGYNCNARGAKNAIDVLSAFDGKKMIVTPGIVECGILEEKINGDLGRTIAAANLDCVVLVGDTLVGCVKKGYVDGGGDLQKLFVVPTLEKASVHFTKLQAGDCVLFLNDLPDVY